MNKKYQIVAIDKYRENIYMFNPIMGRFYLEEETNWNGHQFFFKNEKEIKDIWTLAMVIAHKEGLVGLSWISITT